eukprot:CAMPEP_0206145320 /NCGR_PEP_ID=MMETSP1473-20131121/27028_1 /ASSEMBLY_ACC=CAM_ASM_001109 /TAXON_ID=1461547 /ORGANISM="Stichococcus sp, Strain RCC1054" /LENGTH=48 /DNA_ID= /DNA_START= /DNA_END= /DNA_ORIENTATION=
MKVKQCLVRADRDLKFHIHDKFNATTLVGRTLQQIASLMKDFDQSSSA